MRRLAALGAAVAFVASVASVASCANMGAPPGGPVRTTPPVLLSVAPESGAVNVRARSVVFTFDEVINDRDFDKLFLLSPADGPTRVDWHRERIEVRPRRGFRPNTAYSLTMLAGVADLRGNSTKTGRTIVFSTGPGIPPYLVLGRVFDWMSERAAGKAVVEVIRRPDSLPYVGIADSAGQFGVGPVAAGQYTVRAFIDNNGNRTLDRGEMWDSLAIDVGGGTSPFLELLAAPRDSIPPRLATVAAPDTVTITATFDKPLDPDWAVGAERFRIVDSDSVPLRVLSARTKAQSDSILRARSDTVRADTTARGDSAARRDTSVLRRGGAVVAPAAKPSRRPPPRDITIKLDALTPLHPGRGYRFTAIGVRGLMGPARNTERVFTVPRTRPDTARAGARPGSPAPDSTRSRPDSLRPRPPAKP